MGEKQLKFSSGDWKKKFPGKCRKDANGQNGYTCKQTFLYCYLLSGRRGESHKTLEELFDEVCEYPDLPLAFQI